MIPSVKRVEVMMEILLHPTRHADPTTSDLLLLTEGYVSSDNVRTFLHAYRQRGEG